MWSVIAMISREKKIWWKIEIPWKQIHQMIFPVDFLDSPTKSKVEQKIPSTPMKTKIIAWMKTANKNYTMHVNRNFKVKKIFKPRVSLGTEPFKWPKVSSVMLKASFTTLSNKHNKAMILPLFQNFSQNSLILLFTIQESIW